MVKRCGTPTIKTQKELFALSGNQCAFPHCENLLVREGVIVGQICHIKAVSREGPRYEHEQTEQDRQSSLNLILLCAEHHKIVDGDPSTYTVAKLKKIKSDHEQGKIPIRSAEINKVISAGHAFVTNIFHAPVSVFVQGNESPNNAFLTAGDSHKSNRAALQITVGESSPYVSTSCKNLYQLSRTIRLKLENGDLNKTVHGCKLQLLSIDPSEGYCGPWVLDEGVSIAAGDHKFIPFIRYGEAFDPQTYNCADSFIEVLTAQARSPTMDAKEAHYLRIRATGIDVAPSDLICQVEIDKYGRLQVFMQTSQNLISLREAARRAYEHTLGTELAKAAERHDDTPEGVLAYFADLIVEFHPVSVKKPPSTLIEEYPRELWKKMCLCDHLNGIKHHGARRSVYIDPAIREAELLLFLKWSEQYRHAEPRVRNKA